MDGLTRRQFNTLVGGALGAGALGTGGIARGAAIEDGTLRVGVTEDWFARAIEGGLNPFVTEIARTPRDGPFSVLYEPGVVFGPQGPVPWLYESFEHTRDGRVEATLREGLTWSDGEPLTAGDAAFSAHYVQDNGSAFNRDDAYRSVVEAEPRSERTVLFVYGEGGDWVGRTLGAPVFPRHRWEGIDNPEDRVPRDDGGPVGSGPFRFEDISYEGLRLVARDNPGPRGDIDGLGPHVDAIEFRPVDGDPVSLVSSGDLDIVPSTLQQGTPVTAGALRADAPDDAPLVSASTDRVGTVMFNTRRTPFDTPEFRRALARLWDDAFHAESRGANTRSGGFIVPPSIEWLRPEEAPTDIYPFPGEDDVDIAAARELVAEPDGFRFGPAESDAVGDRELYVEGTAFSELRDGAMEVICTTSAPVPSLERWRDVLNAVGVPTTVLTSPSNYGRRLLVEHDFDAANLQWAVRDGWMSNLPRLLGPAGRQSDGYGLNISGYGGADDILEPMANELLAPEDRRDLVGALSARVFEHTPLFVYGYPQLAEVKPERVSGVRYGLRGMDTPLTWWSVGGESNAGSGGTEPTENGSNATVNSDGGATVVAIESGGAFSADLSGTPIASGGYVQLTGIEGTASAAGQVVINRGVSGRDFGGTVIEYVRIDERGLEVSDVSVSFAVDSGTLESRDIDLNDVALYRRDGSGWTELRTERTTPADGSVGYAATSPGLSQFAVGTDAAAASVPVGGLLDTLESNPVMTGAGALGTAGLLALGNRLRKGDGDPEPASDVGDSPEPDLSELTAVSGISEGKAKSLHRNGFETRADLRAASHEDLRGVPGIGNALAARIRSHVGEAEAESETDAESEANSGGQRDDPDEDAELDEGDNAEPDGDVEPEGAEPDDGSADDAGEPDLPPVAESFAADCDAVGSLWAGATDGPLHTYAGALATGEDAVFRVVAPGVDVGDEFENTARSWAGVDSDPEVATVHDYGEEPRQWLAHEPLEGEPLGDCLDDDLERRVNALGEVCTAVRNAGRYSVRHRDLAPERVYLTDDGEITIAGWGLDRVVREAADPEAPPTWYTAPEQVGNGPEGPATDIYQLGALAYHVITGQPPFADVPESELAAAIREDRPTPPGEIDPELSAFDSRLSEAMAKEMRERYDSPHHLRRGLLAAL